MADLMRRTRFRATLPEALLEGLAWDAEGRVYETLDDLLDYAARVAGAVGVMMTLIMGVRSTEALARACDLGVAMQLTNIARDVGEDARMGRIYLPREWLREAGIDAAAFLADPTPEARVGALVARLLEEASRPLCEGRAGRGPAAGELPGGDPRRRPHLRRDRRRDRPERLRFGDPARSGRRPPQGRASGARRRRGAAPVGRRALAEPPVRALPDRGGGERPTAAQAAVSRDHRMARLLPEHARNLRAPEARRAG